MQIQINLRNKGYFGNMLFQLIQFKIRDNLIEMRCLKLTHFTHKLQNQKL